MIHDRTHDASQEVWPPVLAPTDRPRLPDAAPRCSAVVHSSIEVPAHTAETVPGDVLAAAFAALLFRYTGQDRIALAGPDGETRFPVDGEATLQELAAAGAPGSPAGTEAPVVAFAADGAPARDHAPYELQLLVRGESLELHYDAALFDRDTAVRLLDHYRTLLFDALASPEQPVSRLRLLTGPELHRTLVEWNRTETPLPAHGTLHAAFEARAERAPEAIALVHGSERLTYREINAAANRLAHHLRSLGVGPDVRVGLCLDRSPNLLVAELAVLKAGGAYVPLDPDYPADRIAIMVNGTSCAVMISREALTSNLPERDEQSPPLVLLDRDADVLAARPEHDPEPVAGPEHLCYIIHTSGSTGAPKPIALRHLGVLNNIADLNSRYEVGPGDSVLALSSPSFDMSVYEFLGLTIAGGTVIIPDAGRTKDPVHWAELAAAEGVTVWNSAPALLGLLADQLEQTSAEQLPRLRLALLGGDWVPVPLAERVRVFAPGLRFIVMGGATESSIHSTLFEVEKVDPDWTSIPYGRPMANQRTYILDEALQPVPPGVPGELYLAGIGLARGYLNQPERTAERFIEWSYGEVAERLYRTGDVARFGPDGLIELLGRADFQVKIHGLRVELGEIESVLRSHPAVRQSVVVAHSNRLVAYVVPEAADDTGAAPALDTDALLRAAAGRLPEYMVPAAVVTLDRLPLTPNGKLDRKGLPEPEFTTAVYRAPRTTEEEVLAAVFAEVLGADRVGIDDDFLAVGGDSIRAIQVVTRARARGLEVTPRQILQSRTVAALAAVATGTDPAAEAAGSAPLASPDSAEFRTWQQRYPGLSDVWPLTALQSGILFESTLNDTGYDAYQMQTVFHLSGPVDAARMRAAGQALLDRYANLRVAFVPGADDNLVQLVVDGVELPWQEVDLTGLAPAERDAAFGRFLEQDYARHFDRTAPPLLRLTLVQLGEDRHELVLTTHHVLIDGWSEPILMQDLLRLYASGGDASGLPRVRDFREFLAWLDRQDREETAKAWAEELAGVDEPTLLVPATAPRAQASGAGTAGIGLSEEESRRLFRQASELGVTVNTLVQGAWAVLLGELTGRRDVVFGATVSGRPAALPGVESMVGLFINTLPVRVRCAPGDTLAELLADLQNRQAGLLDHHHHSLVEIHQATGLDTLFDTLVAFQSYPVDHVGIAEATAAAGIEVTGIRAEGAANYPLALIVETEPHLRLTLQYHRNLFAEDAVGDIAERLHAVLRQLLAEPTRRVDSVDVLLDAERERIISGYREAVAAGALAGDTLPALVERHASTHPDAVAVVCDGVSLTYRELNRRADGLARQLVRLGAGPESVVGLALPRSARLAVALLATLKSGAAFVLVDAGQDGRNGQRGPAPAEAGAGLVLTPADVDAPYAVPAGGEAFPAPAPDPQQLAWLRRTPQVDGAPAGVAVSHGALVHGVAGFAAEAGLKPGTRLLAASPHGDAVAFEILAALGGGACVEVVPDAKALAVQGGWTGDVISTAAPFFAGLLNRATGAFRADTVVLTGDTLLASFVQRVRTAIPGVRVVGSYAPAGAVRATVFTAPDGDGGTTGVLPLGAPLDGLRLYVLNESLAPVPAGVTGRLYVGGEVARGYHGRGALTAGHFLPDPFGPAGARMFRTGDLARWDRDGRLEFVGAEGPQAKIRGRRFRTEEVEAVLAAHPAVSQAAVAVRAAGGTGGDDQLVGYVVPLRAGGAAAAPDPEQLREFAARQLPDHMVPAAVVTLEELPLTADGTVDRAALPEPGADTAAAGGHRKGRTPQEEALCEVFAEVLGVERVGIDDNVFSLGCNSLKATRIIGRMRRTLGVEVSIRLLFQHPTIAELSGHLTPAKAKARPALGKSLKQAVRDIRNDTKAQVTGMNAQAKEQAEQLKEQLTESYREQYTGEEFQARIQEDIDNRIQSGLQWGGNKPKDGKDAQRRLKRMLERFEEEVRDGAQQHELTEEQLDAAQATLTATAAALRNDLAAKGKSL
ncbi:amino acid adenylation domain-containing protein [Streptomyces sp. NPDC051211]|uniref:amino acid adenylation domain-containing protein n=1 Tax=Streptomyces sp. NPDC051211 TaxID=3154643 RepID=UPI00344F33CE